MSYFNEEQRDSLMTPAQRAEVSKQLEDLTNELLIRARSKGKVSESEEQKLLRQLLSMKTYDAPDVAVLTRRALVELWDLRDLLKRLREHVDGRRHYDGTEGYTCFDALGDVRNMIDQEIGR